MHSDTLLQEDRAFAACLTTITLSLLRQSYVASYSLIWLPWSNGCVRDGSSRSRTDDNWRRLKCSTRPAKLIDFAEKAFVNLWSVCVDLDVIESSRMSSSLRLVKKSYTNSLQIYLTSFCSENLSDNCTLDNEFNPINKCSADDKTRKTEIGSTHFLWVRQKDSFKLFWTEERLMEI